MNNVLLVIAAAGAPGGGGMSMNFVITMGLMIGIFYFMLIKPQQRKERERQAMIGNIKSGARVIFGGGILGTIANVKDDTFIIKIADNVKVEVARSAVTKVLEKGDKVEGGEEQKK